MTVKIGDVATFANPKSNKKQARKILEEAAEVFGAWQQFDDYRLIAIDAAAVGECSPVDNVRVKNSKLNLINECADLITATSNLLAALYVDDMREAMKACEQRNRERGRL